MNRLPARSLRLAAAALALASASAAVPPPTPAGRPARPALAAAHGAAPATWGAHPARVYDEVAARTVRLAPRDRTRVARAILEESLAAALDPLLVLAVIRVESGFDPAAVSPVGALGLMQLMPPTLAEVVARAGIEGEPDDPVVNVRAGVRYLTALVAAFGDLEHALVAYNAGPAALRAHLRSGGIPERLRGYPRAVLRFTARLASAPPPADARAPVHRPGAAHREPAAAGKGGATAYRDRRPLPREDGRRAALRPAVPFFPRETWRAAADVRALRRREEAEPAPSPFAC